MIFDIIIVATLLISALIAFFRGFIRELLTIMGVLGGGIAAVCIGPFLSPVIEGWLTADVPEGETPEKVFGVVPPEMMADILAYGCVFLLVVILLTIASHYISGWARSIGLGALDRTFGVFFGLVRGFIILAFLYLLPYLLFEKDTRDEWFEGCKTCNYLEIAAAEIAQFIPEDAAGDLRRKADENAAEAARGARERLQDMDMLQDDAPAEGTADEANTEGGPGYERDERRNMNELIMDNVNE